MPQQSLWDDSLTPEQSRPVGLDLDVPRQELRIRWADGTAGAFSMTLLRQNCPCASCRTEREKQQTGGGPAPLLPVLSPAQAAAASAHCTGGQLVGNYALQLEWSDGHSTGIYDFRLLRTLRETI